MEKIKPIITNWIESDRGKDILTVIIVILVGMSSFGLGRLSKGNSSAGIKIEYQNEINDQPNGQTINQEANIISSGENNSKNIPDTETTGKSFFASNRGSKYYPAGCSAGKSLKLENRVYFNTREEAEKAGYELSSSCR